MAKKIIAVVNGMLLGSFNFFRSDSFIASMGQVVKWTDPTRVFVRHFRFPMETIGITLPPKNGIRFLVRCQARRSQHLCTVLFGDAYLRACRNSFLSLEVILVIIRQHSCPS